MKNIGKLLFNLGMISAIFILFAGCKKFLDRKPLNATLDDLSQGTLEAQVLGIYSDLRGDVGTNTLGWLDFHSIRDDDAQKGSSSTDGKEINTEFETFQYTKDDWAPNSYWDDHFSLINKANKVLHYADSLKLTDENSQRNKGEAYFIRAYMYFDLVKTYGEVPLYDYYYDNATAALIAKSPVDAIYTLIDKDLDAATQLLPLTWVTSSGAGYPGRISSGAANTLWAQTYLFRQNWAKVIEKTNIVINSGQYELLPAFYSLWHDGLNGSGKNSKESIYEYQASVGAAGTNNYGSAFGTSQNIRVESAFPDKSWNLGWGWNCPTQALEDAWNAADSAGVDPRHYCTILYSGKSDGGPQQGGYGATLPAYKADFGLDQPYWNKKVYSDPSMRTFTGQVGSAGGADWINHRIFRYADVILMQAEAANEAGDGATAAAKLEMIRARARNTGSDPNAVPPVPFINQAQMRQAIKDERRWEFALEGYRFFDLVRWGDALKYLGPLGYTNRCRYYPIPQHALDQNNKLAQNPEW
jgi:hypothetical protein